MHVTCPGRALEGAHGARRTTSRTVSLVSQAVPGAHFLHDPTTAIDSSVVDPVLLRYLPPAQMTLQAVRAVSYASRRACVVRLQSANMGVEADVQCVQ